MERITLYIRTSKTSGKIRLRFRLTEGRGIQLFYKSRIEANLSELSKFDIDGAVRPRVRIYNERLHSDINREISAMREGYRLLKEENKTGITSKSFAEKVNEILNPSINRYVVNQSETLYDRYVRFMNSLIHYGIISESRQMTYKTVKDKLFRFLTIYNRINCEVSDFKPEDILSFRNFIINEYKYVKEYPLIYKNLDRRSIPSKPMRQNSATLKLRVLSTFFNELENNDEILKSPFKRISKSRRQELMSEQYDEPFSLTQDEVLKIMHSEVSEPLKEVRDVFLLHCALGCRVGDFIKMSMTNVAVSEDGIPYVHYIASKTAKTTSGRKEKTTPLMRYALEIVKQTQFRFELFKHGEAFGRITYNIKIKELLKQCQINRKISQYNETEQKIESVPLYKLATSKLCRKTHIDIASKIQINMYATGLHEAGSSAVRHYSRLRLGDLFLLLCLAFDQPQFRVDDNLDIVDRD